MNLDCFVNIILHLFSNRVLVTCYDYTEALYFEYHTQSSQW